MHIFAILCLSMLALLSNAQKYVEFGETANLANSKIVLVKAISGDPLNWNNANKYCEARFDTTLASVVPSLEDAAFQVMMGKANFQSTDMAWIGYNTLAVPHWWRWIDQRCPDEDRENFISGEDVRGKCAVVCLCFVLFCIFSVFCVLFIDFV